jgi:hypothetical protein
MLADPVSQQASLQQEVAVACPTLLHAIEPPHTAPIRSCKFCQTLLQLRFAATQQELAMTGARAIPIVREEDFASPALTYAVQQLLSQVQSRLVGVLGEDDMPIPACCICHAAHQFWLQLCTYALNRHAHMSFSNLSSHTSAISGADLLALPTVCNTSCCVAAIQSCSSVWQNLRSQMGAV